MFDRNFDNFSVISLFWTPISIHRDSSVFSSFCVWYARTDYLDVTFLWWSDDKFRSSQCVFKLTWTELSKPDFDVICVSLLQVKRYVITLLRLVTVECDSRVWRVLHNFFQHLFGRPSDCIVGLPVLMASSDLQRL